MEYVNCCQLPISIIESTSDDVTDRRSTCVPGCYGVDGESDSIMSSASENSTEPWFCDACKNGVTPSCELCPNQDGIFKETDAGRWAMILHSDFMIFNMI